MPLNLLKLEALLRRIPSNHPKRRDIEEELAKSKAGFKGERSLQFFLDYLSEYYIFHNLRLYDGVHYFQIDFLLISPKFILILEVKNIKGTLFFDATYNQLIRTYQGIEEGFQDPILQAKSHQAKLTSLLQKNKFYEIPVYFLVVITNPKTIVNTNSNNREAMNKVTVSANLLNKIKKLEEGNKVDIFSKREIKKLTSLLLKLDTPLDPQLLDQFSINVSELLTGVVCRKCENYSMQRQSGAWFCPHCLNWDKEAHLAAIKDYALLVAPTISSKTLREFLHLPTRSVATNIINALHFQSSGRGKATYYNLPSIEELHKMENNAQKLNSTRK